MEYPRIPTDAEIERALAALAQYDADAADRFGAAYECLYHDAVSRVEILADIRAVLADERRWSAR